MGKNILSSKQSDEIQTTLGTVISAKHNKAKIIPWDNKKHKTPLKVYKRNISDISTWATATSVTNLSKQQSKNILHDQKLLSHSMSNQSRISNLTQKKTQSIDNKNKEKYSKNDDQYQNSDITYKNVLTIVCASLLGLVVTTALILPNVILYLMLPSIFATPANTTNSIEPLVYAKHCGGSLPYTSWIYYNNSLGGLVMIINTNNCSFNSTPLYYTSIIAGSVQTDFTGYSSIYSATKSKFAVYIRSANNWPSIQTYNTSQTDKWNLSWIGVYY